MPPRKGYRYCPHCKKNRHERFFSSSRAKFCSTCLKSKRSKGAHEQRVMKTYGLQAGEYDKLFEAQQGRCAICKQTRKQRLSVDHDHETGLIRGLACRMCNGRLLTAARDNPETLRAAALYLEQPPAREVLGERFYQGD